MNSMHRQFGKLMSKGPGDNAKVSVLIADYEDADKTLTKVGAMTRFVGVLLTSMDRLSKHQKVGVMHGSQYSIPNWAQYLDSKNCIIPLLARAMVTATIQL
jgi:hypothetical protein